MVCAVLRAYASGRLFGESFGREAAWVLALRGWGRTHRDFAAALGDPGVDGTPLDAIALVATVGEENAAVLRTISCPVALPWGGLDRDVPVEIATELADVLGWPAPTVLAGIGHLVPTEAPQALRGLIVDVRP